MEGGLPKVDSYIHMETALTNEQAFSKIIRLSPHL